MENNVFSMKKIAITYIAIGHHGEKAKQKIEVSLASDIARDLLKKQEESLFLTRTKNGALVEWLHLLAMLQGFSRAKFERAEEVE